MMTAALAPGDAIGNYVFSLVTQLRSWGCQVHLYTDYPNTRYPLPHFHTGMYQPTGRDLLWFHFSIASENVHWLRGSTDFKIFDSHNVSPAYLFRGYDAKMERLCQEGEALLDTFADTVDLTVVHTDYVHNDLRQRGYRNIRKLPLIVDTQRFTGQESSVWTPLLSRLEYLLFVGRIVPQKNLKFMLEVFAALHRKRTTLKLFLVGGKHLPAYAAELEELAERLGIADAVVLTGPMTEPDVLTSFYRHARFSLTLSLWESFCVPIVESLYFGTPVLGSSVPPIPETMGRGGITLQGTAAEMAEQIDSLWDDEQLYHSLQQHGREHCSQFTNAQLEMKLFELFRDLAEGR